MELILGSLLAMHVAGSDSGTLARSASIWMARIVRRCCRVRSRRPERMELLAPGPADLASRIAFAFRSVPVRSRGIAFPQSHGAPQALAGGPHLPDILGKC